MVESSGILPDRRVFDHLFEVIRQPGRDPGLLEDLPREGLRLNGFAAQVQRFRPHRPSQGIAGLVIERQAEPTVGFGIILPAIAARAAMAGKLGQSG